MLSAIPWCQRDSAIAFSPSSPDNTIPLFPSAEIVPASRDVCRKHVAKNGPRKSHLHTCDFSALLIGPFCPVKVPARNLVEAA